MYTPAAGLPSFLRESPLGGTGTASFTTLCDPAVNEKLRLLSVVTLPPHGSVGYHEHRGEMEVYYFLTGRGRIDDNGQTHTVLPGDVTVTRSGESHGLTNIGDGDLTLLALVLAD